MTALDLWTARLETAVVAEFATVGDGSHDLGHVRRVWLNCRAIAAAVPRSPDMLVLLAAAYLHDIVNLPKNAPERAQASVLAAARAGALLTDLGFPLAHLPAVRHAIEAHSFSAEIAPTTLEAEILQDADRLESLGALGIARTFYVGGRLRSDLFDPDDPLATNRALDDRRFALDHFEAKLFRLPDRLNTAAARALAAERVGFMRSFVAQLIAEAGPPHR